MPKFTFRHGARLVTFERADEEEARHSFQWVYGYWPGRLIPAPTTTDTTTQENTP